MAGDSVFLALNNIDKFQLWSMLFLTLARIDSSAAAEIDFVTLANLPPVVRESFENSPQAKRYAFSAHINPFYLCDLGNAGDNFSGLDAWHVFR